MTVGTTARKMKRSFTLSPEAVAYIAETRQKRGTGSDSEALDLMIREVHLEARRQELEAACKLYYDALADEELAEQREWAEIVGADIFLGVQN